MMVNISDKTNSFFRGLKLDDLNSVLMRLRTIPIGDRELVIIDLVHIFERSKSDIHKQFDLLCKK